MDLNRLRLFGRLDSCLISSKKKQGCSSQFVGKNFHCTFCRVVIKWPLWSFTDIPRVYLWKCTPKWGPKKRQLLLKEIKMHSFYNVACISSPKICIDVHWVSKLIYHTTGKRGKTATQFYKQRHFLSILWRGFLLMSLISSHSSEISLKSN